MSKLALLIGNTKYDKLQPLACCKDDVHAINELIVATGNFENISIIENTNSSELKSKIRLDIENIKPSEIFFYYTGHGFSYEEEFFYCATNFDPDRPNETGLSTTELHILLRLADADLVVKIVDACNSGTHLVKSNIGFSQQNKQGFKNLVQISSCLDSQSALTGHPLSVFTEKFRDATLSKLEGAIYYTDIISVLRDQFISNNDQTPFFVSQHTGREQFVDDARKLDSIRKKLISEAELTRLEIATPQLSDAPATLTTAELLDAAAAKLATPEKMATFVDKFFDSLKENLQTENIRDLFDVDFVEHDDFEEATAKRFIIEVLSREKRQDNFVTAEFSRKQRRSNPLGLSTSALFARLYDDEQYIEIHDLHLNCKMNRAQLRIMFTPKYPTLQRIILVVTCAPSLETCYVFEVATQHMLRDFGKYDAEGTSAVRRWYKFEWDESTDGVVRNIIATLTDVIQKHIDSILKRLQEDRA